MAKRTTTKAPNRLGISLDEFAGQMDAYLGKATGAAEAVRTYRDANDRLKVVGTKSAARLAVYGQLDRLITIGQAYAQRRQIVAVRKGGSVRQGLVSADVAKVHPKLWDASRVAAPVLGIKHPTMTPAVWPQSSILTSEQAWEELSKLRAANTLATKQATESRDLLNEVFQAVVEVWPGDPQVTTDGWVLGWTLSERFNEKRCYELAEEQGIDLSAVETRKVVSAGIHYELVDEEDTDGVADYCAD